MQKKDDTITGITKMEKMENKITLCGQKKKTNRGKRWGHFNKFLCQDWP